MLGVFFPGKPFLTALQHDGPRRCAQARGAISEDGSGGGASQETVRERGKGSTEGSGPRRQRLFLRHLACTRPLTRTFFFSSRIRRERERESERECARALHEARHAHIPRPSFKLLIIFDTPPSVVERSGVVKSKNTFVPNSRRLVS